MVFSEKQRRVLTWWRPGSPDRDRQAIIVRQRQDPVHRAVLLLLGHVLLSGAEFCPVRADHPECAAEYALGADSPAGADGVPV